MTGTTDICITIGRDGSKIHPAVKFADGSILKMCSCATSRGGLSNALQIKETTGNPNCKR